MAADRPSRIAQFRRIFQVTKDADPRFVPTLVAVPLTVLVVFVVVGVLLDATLLWTGLGVLSAVAALAVVFGRKSSSAAFTAMEGRPGAAAAVLQSLRGAWTFSPAVAFTRNQDFVHRVVGRPGVVLVGEGPSRSRVEQLLKQEHRKVARAVGDMPVHEVHVGDGEGQVELSKLQAHLMRLPRSIKGGQIGALNRKLEALKGSQPPLPKGPIPQQRRRSR